MDGAVWSCFSLHLQQMKEDSLLTYPNSMMNDTVYYCILSSGLASQKTDNVTNWSISVRKWCVHWAPCRQGPQCPLSYHWQLLFASDDHLLWARKYPAWYLVRWVPWLTHHPWSRTPVFVTLLDTHNGNRKEWHWMGPSTSKTRNMDACTLDMISS